MTRTATALHLALLLGLAAVPRAAAAASPLCAPAAAAAAYGAKDWDRLKTIHATSRQAAAGCSETVTLCVGRLIALRATDRAAALGSRATVDALEAIVREARDYAKPWPVLVLEGDVALARGRHGESAAYTRAARAYEAAFTELADIPSCGAFGEPGPESRAQVAALRKRMVEAKLLAPTFELMRTRAGECGGLFIRSARGFEEDSVPLPVEFAYDSVEFTDKGRTAADALHDCIKDLPRIRLTGHTDERGTDDYNMSLSKRRLDAVARFLAERGFRGAIDAVPMGKRVPLALDDPGAYPPEARDQLNRRVVLQRPSP